MRRIKRRVDRRFIDETLEKVERTAEQLDKKANSLPNSGPLGKLKQKFHKAVQAIANPETGVRKKLFIIAGVLAAVNAAAFAVGVHQMGGIGRQNEQLTAQQQRVQQTVEQLRRGTTLMQRQLSAIGEGPKLKSQKRGFVSELNSPIETRYGENTKFASRPNTPRTGFEGKTRSLEFGENTASPSSSFTGFENKSRSLDLDSAYRLMRRRRRADVRRHNDLIPFLGIPGQIIQHFLIKAIGRYLIDRKFINRVLSGEIREDKFVQNMGRLLVDEIDRKVAQMEIGSDEERAQQALRAAILASRTIKDLLAIVPNNKMLREADRLFTKAKMAGNLA